MNRRQAVALADAIAAFRPDWQQAGILAHLERLARIWPNTDAGLAAFAMVIAADPATRTPGAISATPPPLPAAQQRAYEPSCYICGNTRSRCTPDHEFETADTAASRTVTQKLVLDLERPTERTPVEVAPKPRAWR